MLSDTANIEKTVSIVNIFLPHSIFVKQLKVKQKSFLLSKAKIYKNIVATTKIFLKKG